MTKAGLKISATQRALYGFPDASRLRNHSVVHFARLIFSKVQVKIHPNHNYFKIISVSVDMILKTNFVQFSLAVCFFLFVLWLSPPMCLFCSLRTRWSWNIFLHLLILICFFIIFFNFINLGTFAAFSFYDKAAVFLFLIYHNSWQTVYRQADSAYVLFLFDCFSLVYWIIFFFNFYLNNMEWHHRRKILIE